MKKIENELEWFKRKCREWSDSPNEDWFRRNIKDINHLLPDLVLEENNDKEK